MTDFIHPALVMILGAAFLPFIKGALRKPFLVLVPVLAFGAVLTMQHGNFLHYQFLDWNLTFGVVDSTSYIFGFIMALMAIIGTVYNLHGDDAKQHIAAWLYVAGSQGVIFAGDYIVLFLFWELMAFASTFLIWFRNRPQSLAAGYRYLLVHTAGGLILLAGIMFNYKATGGDITFTLLDVAHPTIGTYLIMLGFALNAAVVPLHAWLPDAYSEASIGGAVFMCAFTTKTAVYVLIRSCAGMDILIPLGVFMALYGVIYAMMENDIRKFLAYDIISQVGYMVAGVGIGTQLAINGACAHAFAHILYKGLLFMGTGSIIHMTGKSKFTELGGLYKKMPLTLILTMVGGLSISAAPFFSGFVSKSMIVSAAFGDHHLLPAAFLLMVAATATFMLAGLKLPYFIWFGKNNCSEETWEKAADPPKNMLVAMAIAAFSCIFIGLPYAYKTLYHILPYADVALEYHPYGGYHLAETMQILLFGGLAFFLFKDVMKPRNTISIDMDWFYRFGGRGFLWMAKNPIQKVDTAWSEAYSFAGMSPLMMLSKFWSWFDWNAIDGFIDGLAKSVWDTGSDLRKMQPAQLQYSIFIAVSIATVALIGFILV